MELLTSRGVEWQGEKSNSLESAFELGTSRRTVDNSRRWGSSPTLLHRAGICTVNRCMDVVVEPGEPHPTPNLSFSSFSFLCNTFAVGGIGVISPLLLSANSKDVQHAVL